MTWLARKNEEDPENFQGRFTKEKICSELEVAV